MRPVTIFVFVQNNTFSTALSRSWYLPGVANGVTLTNKIKENRERQKERERYVEYNCTARMKEHRVERYKEKKKGREREIDRKKRRWGEAQTKGHLA